MPDRSSYRDKLAQLEAALARNGGFGRIRKATSSNLFRYGGRDSGGGKAIDLSAFNEVIHIDRECRTVEAEGLTTFETLVRHTLAAGFLPTVSPELKHITVGGAVVGIGIESTGFRHGFVHDGIVEADVLLGSGEIVTTSAESEADLFDGLPNSYGTLGYILRVRMRLIEAKPYVAIDNTRCRSVEEYVDAFAKAVEDDDCDFIEGLFYGPDELYLTRGTMTDDAPATVDIYRDNVYYRYLRENASFHLDTFDYIFRYDPDWFWNIPETPLYNVFRRHAPLSMRSSKFYNRYVAAKARWRRRLGLPKPGGDEQLIQDWEVPWDSAVEFMRYALAEVDLGGKPWVAVPIRPLRAVTLYPLQPGAVYMNVGCYCYTKKPRRDIDYYYTRILDKKCMELGGRKMLYSSSFFTREEFDQLYGGEQYRELKRRYDPDGNLPTLFEKAVTG